jgi:hypothetical protein
MKESSKLNSIKGIPIKKHWIFFFLFVCVAANAGITEVHYLGFNNTKTEKQKKSIDCNTFILAAQRSSNKSNIRFPLLETSSVSKTIERLDKTFANYITPIVCGKIIGKFFARSYKQNRVNRTSKTFTG